MGVNNLPFTNAPSQVGCYGSLQPLISVFNGGAGSYLSITGIDDDGHFALDVLNNGTGGGGRIRGSGGAGVLVNDSTVQITGALTTAGISATTLSTSGLATLNSLSVTTSATVGTTLGVTGAFTGSTGVFSSTLSAAATTITGNLTVQAAGPAVKFFVDTANSRTLVGSSTALTGAASSVFEVTGLAYFTPASAGEVALNIWRSPAAAAGWGIGVTSTDQLKFTDNGGQGILTIGDTSSTYQLEVTGDFHVTDDSVFTGDVEMVSNLTGTSGIFDWQNGGNSRLKINSTGVGFFGADPVGRPTVVGTLTAATLPQLTAVVASLLAALDETELGLVTDSTT